MEHYGTRGTAPKWFTSYLTNRKQYTYLNGHKLSTEVISCGVPQGSVLGPLLFLLYINNLPNISNVLTFFLFADDTNIYYESDSLTKLEAIINRELKKLHTWLIVNRLALNIEKTNFVIFHTYNKKIKKRITLKINNRPSKKKITFLIQFYGAVPHTSGRLRRRDHAPSPIVGPRVDYSLFRGNSI